MSTQYQVQIAALECNNDLLQSELDASLEKSISYSREISKLTTSELRDSEDQLASSSREIDMATERQNEKIELSTEDCRNATELYMDTKDNVAKAVLDRNDLANECIARHQAELGEKEYKKISKEGMRR